MPSTAATTTAMYSGRQPAITALMATFSAVTDTDRFVMNAICCLGSRRAAASIIVTRSSVGGTTGRPSVHPCWKQNSPASTSSTRYRLDVNAAAIGASSQTTFMAQQYSAAPGSAPPAHAGHGERRGGGDRQRRDQERLSEGAEEAHGGGAGGDDLAGDRDARHDAQGPGQEGEAAGGPLLPGRECGHDRRHVRDLEEAEPEAGDEERQPDHRERSGPTDEAEPGDGRCRRSQAIGESSSQRRRDRRAEGREHEEEAAREGAEPARLYQVERRQQPDREDRAPGDE